MLRIPNGLPRIQLTYINLSQFTNVIKTDWWFLQKQSITLLRVIPTMAFQGIYSDIYFDIYSDILPNILSDILSAILSGIIFGIYSGILSGILSDIYSDISIWHSLWHSLQSGNTLILRVLLGSGGEHWDLALAVEVGGGGGGTADIKSNHPHLTGKEKEWFHWDFPWDFTTKIGMKTDQDGDLTKPTMDMGPIRPQW